LYARQFFRGNRSRRSVRDQPGALSKECQQQASRQHLWPAEPSPSKKRPHKAKRLFYHVSAWSGRKPNGSESKQWWFGRECHRRVTAIWTGTDILRPEWLARRLALCNLCGRRNWADVCGITCRASTVSEISRRDALAVGIPNLGMCVV